MSPNSKIMFNILLVTQIVSLDYNRTVVYLYILCYFSKVPNYSSAFLQSAKVLSAKLLSAKKLSAKLLRCLLTGRSSIFHKFCPTLLHSDTGLILLRGVPVKRHLSNLALSSLALSNLALST